jgi:hypothetical protein
MIPEAVMPRNKQGRGPNQGQHSGSRPETGVCDNLSQIWRMTLRSLGSRLVQFSAANRLYISEVHVVT